MFYNHQINSLNELEKATLLEISNIIPHSGAKVEEADLINLRKDVLQAKIDFAMTKINSESGIWAESTAVIDQIRLKLNLQPKI